MNSDNGYIEIVSLHHRPVDAVCVSDRLISILETNRRLHKKTLLFYNRRGSAHAWICQDCGFSLRCPNCDIAFSYHLHPRKMLLCHHCGRREPCPVECPDCHGVHFSPIGVGIEQIANTILQKIDTSLTIIDTDHRDKIDLMMARIDTHEVILATQMGNFIEHPDIASVVFLLFEMNLAIGEYDIEEEIYATLAFFKKQKIPLAIQTYAPDHPLLRAVVFGNYREYLDTLIRERKKFAYPPYAELAILRIHHRKQENVREIATRLLTHLNEREHDDVFIGYDPDMYEKSQGEYLQKILFKGRGVSDLIESIERMIVLDQHVTLEWKNSL